MLGIQLPSAANSARFLEIKTEARALCGTNEVKETEENASKSPARSICRYFCFQFVYQVGHRPTLISTMCKVNI